VPAQRVEDGINAARLMLPLTWFDAEKCERGINALRNYRRHWDDKHKAFRDRPLHDWASHGCDAFRYLALSGVQNARAPKKIVYPKLGIV
jgi:phage terminase large subunit